MCCSAWPVKFRGTITGTNEVVIDNTINHVLWYQNIVGDLEVEPKTGTPNLFNLLVERAMEGLSWSIENQARSEGITEADVEAEMAWRLEGKPKRSLEAVHAALSGDVSNGNCLIIPLLGTWESIKLLNTADTPKLLQNIGDLLMRPGLAAEEVSAGGNYFDSSEPARMVHLRFDIYDIVISERASAVADVLSQIIEYRRPEVNKEVFDALEKWYGCPIAVCCFSNDDAFESKPIAFAFEPLYPNKICLYTLDGHDGRAPDLMEKVKLDHTLFVGSSLMEEGRGHTVYYSDEIPDHLDKYVPKRILGIHTNERIQNGDYIFDTEEVRKGVFNGLRVSPPLSPQLVTNTANLLSL